MPMFTNRSELLLDNPVQLSYGIAVTDVDGDGAYEAYVTGFNGYPNLVLKWTGAGFEDIADPVLADAERMAIGVAACDIDGDGAEEIYVLNTDTFGGAKRFGDRIFKQGALGWVDLFSFDANQPVVNLVAGRSVACLDRDGDGRYGFFVSNYGGPMRLYELDENGVLRDRAPELDMNRVTGGRSLLALPLISERMDLFAGNENGPNFLWVNQGDGTFQEVALAAGIDDPFENVRGVAALDANYDGRFDLAYGNWEGPHRLFIQTPERGFIDIASADFATPSRVRTVIAADFDNDGAEEIFFNNIGEPNRLFGLRDGQWVSLPIGDALEPDGLGTGAAIGDFNRDGRLELLIAHGESGAQQLSLYEAPNNDNAWMRVAPLTRHGAPARGAVVRLVAGGRTQLRAIDAGSGYLCQMEPVAHFGLGTLDQIDSLEIIWPDGARQTLVNPPLRQTLTVAYPRGGE
jgi:hypothetical protein